MTGTQPQKGHQLRGQAAPCYRQSRRAQLVSAELALAHWRLSENAFKVNLGGLCVWQLMPEEGAQSL